MKTIEDATRAAVHIGAVLMEQALADAARATLNDGVTRYVWSPIMTDVSDRHIKVRIETTLEPPQPHDAPLFRVVDADTAAMAAGHAEFWRA